MQKYILWAASGVVTLVMAMGGIGKLSGSEMMHASFATLGLPGWFGYFIGVCEVAGAIGIWIPRLSALAALGISIIMLGAIYFHIAHTPIAQAIPALVVLICCGYIFTQRKAQAFWA